MRDYFTIITSSGQKVSCWPSGTCGPQTQLDDGKPGISLHVFRHRDLRVVIEGSKAACACTGALNRYVDTGKQSAFLIRNLSGYFALLSKGRSEEKRTEEDQQHMENQGFAHIASV